ncbi:MAG: hypothetical protein JW841_08940 [Deltaproteobacteria bacterium]|nr:hypothetical protein [Deltaproteobacteria bacterium]
MSDNADCLLLSFANHRYVVVADEVKNIASSLEVLSFNSPSTFISVDTLLHENKNTSNYQREYWLQVIIKEKPTWLCTHANIEVISLDVSGFFQLPALLRLCGCAPWIKGIVVLNVNHSQNDPIQLAIWIELSATPESIDTHRSVR